MTFSGKRIVLIAAVAVATLAGTSTASQACCCLSWLFGGCNTCYTPAASSTSYYSPWWNWNMWGWGSNPGSCSPCASGCSTCPGGSCTSGYCPTGGCSTGGCSTGTCPTGDCASGNCNISYRPVPEPALARPANVKQSPAPVRVRPRPQRLPATPVPAAPRLRAPETNPGPVARRDRSTVVPASRTVTRPARVPAHNSEWEVVE